MARISVSGGAARGVILESGEELRAERIVASVTPTQLYQRLLENPAPETAAEVRNDLLARIMKLDGDFYLSHPPGYLIQRVQTDVTQINAVWRAVITGAARDAIGLLVLMGVAINIDPVWALLACTGIPVLVLPAVLAQKFVRRRAREARDLGATLATRLDEKPVLRLGLHPFGGDLQAKFAGHGDDRRHHL